MNLVNGTQVARLASVTKAAVSLAKKRGRLPVDPSGLFDLDSRTVKNWIRDHSGQRRAGAHVAARNEARRAKALADENESEEEEDIDALGLTDFEKRLLPRIVLRLHPTDPELVDESDPMTADIIIESRALRENRPRIESIPRLAAVKLASDLHRLTRDIPAEIDGPALGAAIDKAFRRWSMDTLHEDFDAIRAEFADSARSTI